MAIKKPLIWLFATSVLFIAVAAVLLLRYEGELHDPCKQQTRAELAKTYPALAELPERQNFESNQLLARQRAQDFMINLEMSSEQVDLEAALKASTSQIDEVAALRRRHSQDFYALCRELVEK